LNYITDIKTHIQSIIKTKTQYKSLVLEHDDYPFKLQFLDLKLFLLEGDLDKYTTKFAKVAEKQKGIFLYELLSENTFVEELNQQDLFKYEDFNSSLKGKNISESEYNNFFDLSKNMNRLEYLEWYNTQDVIIMCPIIDFLIHKFAEYNVDMLRNISLSSCANQVKFAMAYKDFNINSDYSQIETTFKISEEYSKKKVDGYLNQDTNAERNISKNITMKDYEYFKQLLENSKCSIYNEGFTETNKPTLNRKNNKISHTKDNLVPCCGYCN
jgi:hypothetical protein